MCSAGIEALFRSDHYLSVDGQNDLGALDAWGTICALASVTERVRLGTLVTGVTYRNPALLAKIVTTLDIISKGRAILGRVVLRLVHCGDHREE